MYIYMLKTIIVVLQSVEFYRKIQSRRESMHVHWCSENKLGRRFTIRYLQANIRASFVEFFEARTSNDVHFLPRVLHVFPVIEAESELRRQFSSVDIRPRGDKIHLSLSLSLFLDFVKLRKGARVYTSIIYSLFRKSTNSVKEKRAALMDSDEK